MLKKIALLTLTIFVLPAFTDMHGAPRQEKSLSLPLTTKVKRVERLVARTVECYGSALLAHPDRSVAIAEIRSLLPPRQKIPTCAMRMGGWRNTNAETKAPAMPARFAKILEDATQLCLAHIHAMMNACDSYFAEGVGEEFFMGPFLDLLPPAMIEESEGSAGR